VNEHDRDQAAAAALGGLTPGETARLEEQAGRDPALAAELEGYRAAVSLLEGAVAREAPPPDLFDRILERVEVESGSEAAPPAKPRARPAGERWRRFWPAFAAGAASAAAAAVVVLALTGGDDLGSADFRAAVQGTEAFPAVSGEARLFASSAEDGVLELTLDDVPAPGPGEHYEVWVLRGGGEGEMEAVGVFSPTGSSVALEFRLPGPGAYRAVDVSVEPDGGPAEHSGRSLAGGSFEPASA
jgi:anti-sigma-K factor RskA